MSHSTREDGNVDYDVVIAGGGPAGSTTAARLASYGHRVLLLEEKRFPRFHIGESLLIGARSFLTELGLVEEMDRRFLKKYGGTYIWGKGNGPDDLDYWEIYWKEEIPFLTDTTSWVWQVERASFDELLLRNAQTCGTTVVEEARVTSIDIEDDAVVRLTWTDKSGTPHTPTFRYFVDATGQSSLIATKQRWKEYHEQLRHTAIGGRFENCGRFPGRQVNNLVVIARERGWLWFIPLSDTVTSVGYVFAKSAHADYSAKQPEELLLKTIARCPYLTDIMRDARLMDKVWSWADWSYRSREVMGKNYFLVGDAQGFIDPILSSGVTIALQTAQLAAYSIHTLLQKPDHAEIVRDAYTDLVRLYFDAMYRLVCLFYDFNRSKQDYFWDSKRQLGELFGIKFEALYGSDVYSKMTPKQSFAALSGLVFEGPVTDLKGSAERLKMTVGELAEIRALVGLPTETLLDGGADVSAVGPALTASDVLHCTGKLLSLPNRLTKVIEPWLFRSQKSIFRVSPTVYSLLKELDGTRTIHQAFERYAAKSGSHGLREADVVGFLETLRRRKCVRPAGVEEQVPA
jgi:flavin-dependent dehydrogenase